MGVMAGFHLLALATLLILSTTEGWKVRKSYIVEPGIEYRFEDESTTNTEDAPWLWLSNVGVTANLATATSKCNDIGEAVWEIGYQNSSAAYLATAAALLEGLKLDDPDKKLDPERESDRFWLGTRFNETHGNCFKWTKTGKCVFKLNIWDTDKEFVDSKNKAGFGLVAYRPKDMMYKPADVNEKHRYMCTRTKGSGDFHAHTRYRPTPPPPPPTTTKKPKKPPPPAEWQPVFVPAFKG